MYNKYCTFLSKKGKYIKYKENIYQVLYIWRVFTDSYNNTIVSYKTYIGKDN